VVEILAVEVVDRDHAGRADERVHPLVLEEGAPPASNW
jgi:hypothetical protein